MVVGEAIAIVIDPIVAAERAALAGIGRRVAPRIAGRGIGAEVGAPVVVVVDTVVADKANLVLARVVRAGAARVTTACRDEVRTAIAIIIEPVVAREQASLIGVRRLVAARIAQQRVQVVVEPAVAIVVGAVVARRRTSLRAVHDVAAAGIPGPVAAEVDPPVVVVVDAVVAGPTRELGRPRGGRACAVTRAVLLEVELAVAVVVEPVIADIAAVFVRVVGVRAAGVIHVDEPITVVVDPVGARRLAGHVGAIDGAVAVVVAAVGARGISARSFDQAGGLLRIVIVAVLDPGAARAEAHTVPVVVGARRMAEAVRTGKAERAVFRDVARERHAQPGFAGELIVGTAVRLGRARVLRTQVGQAALVRSRTVLIAVARAIAKLALLEAARGEPAAGTGEQRGAPHQRTATTIECGVIATFARA